MSSNNPPERLLLGPGPSPVSARVMRAMSAPVLTAPGTQVLAIVTGYFGDRLAQMFKRYGAAVTLLDVEWGRACDPAAVERALAAAPVDILAVVHAETSTGVLNPLQEIAGLASRAGVLTVADAVTSLGGHPVRTADWGVDVCYSCSQKGLGAPSGLSPISFSTRALARRVPSRSFYLDLALLEDYWVRRRYHHTLSAPLMYALREALASVEEEGLDARWARHERHHLALAALDALGLSLLPPEGERLWTLNAVRVPDGIDEAAVRRRLLEDFSIAPSVGSRGDSYDNALAESVIGLFKTEVIRLKGPWRSLEAVEFATLDWVNWFNTQRLLEPIGYVPPAEYVARYYEQAAVA